MQLHKVAWFFSILNNTFPVFSIPNNIILDRTHWFLGFIAAPITSSITVFVIPCLAATLVVWSYEKLPLACVLLQC